MSELDSATVWRFFDGRPGHDNQSAGLVRSLGTRLALQLHDIPATKQGWKAFDSTRVARNIPNPTLIIGAGRRTHHLMLMAQALYGGRTVVMMRPSPSPEKFDLCLIPAHDHPALTSNILVTQGALNIIQPRSARTDSTAMVLLGGPSRHYDWLDKEIAHQVDTVVARTPTHRWTICDSPRTPERTQALLRSHQNYVHWSDEGPGWLAEQLPLANPIWVTEDSVSMVYEALSTGAAVGILGVARRRRSRVAGGIATLIADGLVTPYGMWVGGQQLPRNSPPLAEADRCAGWIVDNWFTGGPGGCPRIG
ncbi:MAG: nucleoside-diphosphate sugar epimerase [Chromatiales bacterium]|nr:nucleoside-diphosphate sugar epimerase [Chromatiales bacterium]